MKEKRTYSLTARERKALRNADKNKQQKPQKPQETELSERERSEHAMVAAQKRSKRTTAIVVVAVCLAVLLILAAVITPIVAYVINPYRGMGKVIARFNLSNGMTLEYEIQESEYDIAATNFIFLAKNGYFDNTVFFDAQNGWLRFGGYEGQPTTNYSSTDYSRTKHHKDNIEFCEAFTAIPHVLTDSSNTDDRVRHKFGYRLYADKNGTNDRELEKEGVLAFWYNNSATEFQFSYQEQATNLITSLGSDGKPDTNEILPTMVGRVLNDETLQNIKEIAATARLNAGMSTGYQWKPPSPDIMINSVKVYNLDDAKWKDMDFIAYLTEPADNHTHRYSQWIGYV